MINLGVIFSLFTDSRMLRKPHIIYTRLRFCTTPIITKKLHLKCLPHQLISSNGAARIPVRLIGTAADQKDPFRKEIDVGYPERKITVYTCENVYQKWQKEGWVFKLPKSGVHAEIAYIDTIEYFNEKGLKPTKTVLCIHGIPGNYGVFNYLIKDLTREGVRVVVPTFPGINANVEQASVQYMKKNKERNFCDDVFYISNCKITICFSVSLNTYGYLFVFTHYYLISLFWRLKTTKYIRSCALYP